MRFRQPATVAAAMFVLLLVAAPAGSQAPGGPFIYAADNVFTSDGGAAPNVTIAAGGHVNFAYPLGKNPHNVVFTGALPTVCGSSGGPPATASALPGAPAAAGWDGGCDFAAPGTYPFVCGLHSTMTGSVTVLAAGAAPPPPPPPASPPPPPAQPTSPPASLAPAASGLRVTNPQRGFTVRGSIKVARPSSRLLARSLARRGALFGGRSVVQVQVGRQLRASVGAGRVAFAVSLSAAGRRAVRRSGRLAISLRISVTPARGAPYTATRTVILRAP